MSKDGKFPPEVISQWPEIFKDVEVKAVPVKYIKSIQVQFNDGKIWIIDIDQTKVKESDSSLEDELEAFFEHYEDVIESIDFKLDTRQVIEDVKRRTRSFMKKRK